MLSKTDHYFLTIAKEGNLNRAAEALYVSQPSLTKYVQRLERQVGAPLFDRSVSPMRLNDAGRRYLQYVMEQNALEEEMLTQIAEIGRMERGTLRLGIPSYCGQCYLPRVLREFSERYPVVSVELFEGRGEQIECALADRQIDLGIVHLPVSSSAFCYRELFSEHVLLAVPGGEASPDAKSGGFCIPEGTIADFSGYSFIMPHAEQKLGKIVSDLFCRADFRPKILFHTQNIYTVLSMAEAGLGAGFVPAGGLSELPQNILSKVTFYRLKELDHDNWKLVALQRKGCHTPAYTDCFIQLLAKHGQISNRIDRGVLPDVP